MSKSRSLTQNSNVAGKRKIILDRQTREKERKEKPIAMGLSFGCTLESPEGIYKFLCPGQNTKPSKSLSLEGRKRVVLGSEGTLKPRGWREVQLGYRILTCYLNEVESRSQNMDKAEKHEKKLAQANRKEVWGKCLI